MNFISELQQKHNCPFLVAGDFFDHWKPSPELLALVAKAMPKDTYCVYGNHDLPEHSISQKHRSGLYALEASGVIKMLPFGYWKDVPGEEGFRIKNRNIFIWHKCVYRVKEQWMDSTDSVHARKLLKIYPQFDVIVTGDNHQPFIEELDGRLLVNCGSLMRIRASQVDYKPCVYLYYADTNEVEKVYLPIEIDVFTVEHLEKKQDREQRISEFVKSLGNWESGLDFYENLKLFEQKNKPEPEVMRIIYKSMDAV